MTPIPDERISHLSTEYIRAPVIATEAGAAVNPTSDTVEMAFPAEGEAPADWVAASWETAGTIHFARCHVGPDGGDIELDAGLYDVYVKITDSPEVPVKKSGLLEVY